MMVRSSLPWMCALVLAGGWFVLDAREARACGGCFHSPPPPTEVDGTVVTDHRMVLSLSPTQTVLWDQVRYSGNPSDFAWVLPVKPGAVIELSQDAWIGSLDAQTETFIQGPTPNCPSAGPPTEYDDNGGGGGGAGCGASDENAAGFGASGGGYADAGAGPGYGYDAGSPVQVVSQQVVGPYDAVTVRASQGEALGDWLRANGYAIPDSIQPTIDAFTTEGFDFIALRLAPGEGVQAMQPVRIVTEGADPSLPLRMVAAGVGANVGLELYILSEGRYHPQNFPDATIDFSQLTWDPYQSRSNYTELATAALAADAGTAWLTEYSGPANLYGNASLSSTYQQSCHPVTIPPPASCGGVAEAGAAPIADAAGDTGQGAAGDSALDDASEGDAQGETGAPGSDAGTPQDEAGEEDAADVDSGTCASTVVPCDDLSLALTGIAKGGLWVTRLRANLPSSALGADLILEASPDQTVVSSTHTTQKYSDPSYNPCPATSSAATTSTASSPQGGCACETPDARRHRYADALVGMLLFAFGASVARRRRRVA